MKKAAIILVIFLGLSWPHASNAYKPTEIIPVVNDVISETDKTFGSMDENSTDSEITAALSKISASYRNAAVKIKALFPEGDKQKSLQTRLAATFEKLQTSVEEASSAFARNDNDGVTKALNQHDAYTPELNQEIDEMNKLFDLSGSDYTVLYAALTIIFGLISVGLFIASRVGDKILESAVLQNKLQFQLFKSSLWPTIGSLISLVWYVNTPPGGTYYVLWGPIAIGGFIFAKQYVGYLGEKKQLHQLRVDEQAKLTAIQNPTSTPASPFLNPTTPLAPSVSPPALAPLESSPQNTPAPLPSSPSTSSDPISPTDPPPSAPSSTPPPPPTAL